MEQSFQLISCPNQHHAHTVCLTHTCRAPPFSCDIKNCKCTYLHLRCKSMKLDALQDYLINWKKWISKGSKEFMTRVAKIYQNVRDKLQRQETIFENYCKDLLLGKSYSEVVFLIEKRDFGQLTPELLSASVQKITQTVSPTIFDAFTLSQMKKIDEKIKILMQSVEQLYKGKQVKVIEPQRFARCNSATLSRGNSHGQSQLTKSLKIDQNPMKELLKLKVDLSYPKSINSRIISDAACLNKLIGKKIKKYHLAYRGSQSSFNISEFYRKVKIIQEKMELGFLKKNEKTQILTVILVKTQYDKIIGGFTSLKWEKTNQKSENIESDEDQYNPQRSSVQKKKPNHKFRCDSLAKTNIFSLDLMERYDLIRPEEAIYCGKSSIGFGRGDIKIVQKGNTHRKSYCKFPSSYNSQKRPYLNISKSGMSLSGCKYSPFFKLEEWQAFLVQF